MTAPSLLIEQKEVQSASLLIDPIGNPELVQLDPQRDLLRVVELTDEGISAGPTDELLQLKERVFFLRVFVQSLSHFNAVNRFCLQWFGIVHPPARACVELSELSCLAKLEYYVAPIELASPLHHLHVQSLSCWAPACIGPYSQVTYLPDLNIAYLAGQIALNPPTHTLAHADDILAQARLVSRHIASILACIPHVLAPVSFDHVVVWNVYLQRDFAQCSAATLLAVRQALGLPEKAIVHWLRTSALPRDALIEVQVVVSPPLQ